MKWRLSDNSFCILVVFMPQKAVKHWQITGVLIMCPIKLPSTSRQSPVSWPLHRNREECESLDWSPNFVSSSMALTLPGSCLNHIQCLESCHVLKHSSAVTGEQSPRQSESSEWTHSGNIARSHWHNTWEVLFSKHFVQPKMHTQSWTSTQCS